MIVDDSWAQRKQRKYPMLRGSLSNTQSPTIWIHSDVLIREDGRVLLVGPKKYKVIRKDWLWAISYFVKPVIVYIDTAQHIDLIDYDKLFFDSFNECKDALRRDQRAVELVVEDPNLVSRDIVLYSTNTGKYS